MNHDRGSWVRARASSLSFVLLVSAFVSLPPLEAASSIEKVECGQSLTREFDEAHQIHDYKLWMEPGESIQLRVLPVGDTLSVRVYVSEPAGQEVRESNYDHEVRLATGKLSGRGIHTVRVENSEWPGGRGDSRVGVYTLDITCIRSNGSKVEPGGAVGGSAADSGGGVSPPAVPAAPLAGLPGGGNSGDVAALGKYADDVQQAQATANAVTTTLGMVSNIAAAGKNLFGAFRGKKNAAQPPGPAGAPPTPVYQRPEDVMGKGHSALDARPVALAPPAPAAPAAPLPLLSLGSALEGEIAPASATQGCRFRAAAGDRVELSFERTGGDLGLALRVLGPGRKLIFESSVLANPRVSTTLPLAVAGEYTVEVAVSPSADGGGAAQFRVGFQRAAK